MRTPKTWRHQYERVMRFYERLEAMTRGKAHTCPTAMLEDDALAFFQNCYHLKDWLRHDPASGVTKQEVHAYINAHEELRSCRRLCNGTKHLLPDEPDFGSKSIRYSSDGVISVSFNVETITGDEISAYDLATKCVELWRKFLGVRGLLDGPPLCEGIPAEDFVDMVAALQKAQAQEEMKKGPHAEEGTQSPID